MLKGPVKNYTVSQALTSGNAQIDNFGSFCHGTPAYM